MAIRFSMNRQNWGLDTTERPAWVMVPMHGVKHVIVDGARGFNMIRTRPNSLGLEAQAGFDITEHGDGDRRTIEIRGTRPGLGAIEYFDDLSFMEDNPAPRRLQIAVKTRRDVQAAFHYVTDGNQQITRRRPTDLDGLLRRVNAILMPQTNVCVVRRSTRWLRTARNLGRYVIERRGYRGGNQRLREFSYLKGLGDSTADLNVFFVRRYERRLGDGRDTEASAERGGNDMIMEDRVDDDAETFAHEITHHLGLSHSDAIDDTNLNARGSDRTGQFIPRRLADRMNPTRLELLPMNPFAGAGG